MASWTNATAPTGTAQAQPSGLLRPAVAVQRSGLRRDYPVAPALRPFVERYWSVRWSRPDDEPFRSEVLTHACVNLSFESGSGPRHGVALPAALVHGANTRRFVIELRGWGRVTAAKFRPGGFAALTGEHPPPGTVRTWSDTGGLLADVLVPDGDPDRVAVLDVALAARAPEPAPEYLELRDVIALMAADRGLTRVDQVAAAAGTSVRALQRLFHRYVGVGPKWVLAGHRVRDAAATIDAGGGVDLAALAADLGWFDQAHFSRDFRAAVGVTPSSYLSAARSGARA